MADRYVGTGGLGDGTDLPIDSAGLSTLPVGPAQEAANERFPRSGTLIVIEPRDFVRGCVVCWLGSLCADFATVAVSEVDPSFQAQAIEQAAAVLIGVSSAQTGYDWLVDQIVSLRAERVELPIILIVEPEETTRADALARRLSVQGYVPTSSTVAVAAAALRLVIAGGTYFPTERSARLRSPINDAIVSTPVTSAFASARLTPREEAVLGVLASGAQNKIIAYKLGMSLSTVKAHVHNIISKLKVRNRTEVVVAARTILVQSREKHLDVATALVPGSRMHARAD